MSAEKTAKTSTESDMDKQSESAVPLNPSYQDETDIRPFAYAKFVVAYPKYAFGFFLGMHLLMILLTIILAASGYDIISVKFSSVPLSLEEDSTKLRTDAWWHVKSDASVTPSSSLTSGQEERSVLYQPLELVYEKKDGNVFTRENLLAIKDNEDELFHHATYQSELCQLQGISNRTCKLPLSVLRFFDGTFKTIDSVFDDPEFNSIVSVFTTAKSMNTTSAILDYHLGVDAVIDEEKGLITSKYTRSLFYFGWPLKGYMATEDDEDGQKKKLDELISDTYGDTLSKKYKNKVGSMNFYYFNYAMMKEAINSQVIYDMMLAVASFLFIFFFMWLQTGSLWLTGWGIFSIISSFNIANFVYRVIFDYRYIGTFHVLSIFIILGIGSDNIFVFMDTWKEYGRNGKYNLENRLSIVYRSAAKATFITSLTTTIAFISNVISPLLAVSSFGLFSAILVAVNYVSCILFFPTVIILHELTRKGKCCCGKLWQCRQTQPSPTTSLEMTNTGETSRNTSNGTGNVVIDFLEGWFFINVVTHKYVRWIVLLFFLVLVSVFIGFAAQLKPDEKQVNVWGENTNWGKIAELRNSAFRSSQEDDVVVVHIIWGLHNQDRSSCHHTDYKCKGKTVLDKSFDTNPPPCQLAMLEFCKKIKHPSKEHEEKLRLRRSAVTGEVETQCVFERIDEWLQDESTKVKYPPGSDFSLPTTESKIRPLMAANPDIYNVTALPDTYYRYFEAALGFFLFDGRSSGYANNYDFEVYSKLLGGALEDSISRNATYTLQGNKYGHRLLYLAIAVNTSLNPSTLPFESGLPIYENWEDFVNEEVILGSIFPVLLTFGGFTSTQPPSSDPSELYKATTNDTLVNSAIAGILIGLSSSFVVLVIATTNLVVGLLASLTISLITCAVLGMITMLGWKLGVLESLNLTLVVGLAVDYVVHLAEGYMELKGANRLERVRQTLSHVGISVLSGACTTLGASTFMLAAKIIFFFQFGIFMFCTIGFSILFSLLFFTTVLAIIGPQEDEKGSIIPAVKFAKDFLRGKRRGYVDCEICHGKGFICDSTEK